MTQTQTIYQFVTLRFLFAQIFSCLIVNFLNLCMLYIKEYCFIEFWKTHWKAPLQGCLFNKVKRLHSGNLSKKSLWHRCFPVNLVTFIRIIILKTPESNWFLSTKCFCWSHFLVREKRILTLYDNNDYITPYKKTCFFLNIYFSFYHNISVFVWF